MSDRAPVKRAPAPGLLENVFEDFPDAIVITSASGEIVAANRQAETMFGYARAELLGLAVGALIPERCGSIHAGHRKNSLPEPQARPTEIGLDHYGKRKDGSEFPVDIILSPLGTVDGGGALRVIRDVTVRWETEEALRQSEERFRLLVEGAKDYAIFMIDPNGLVGELESRCATNQGLPCRGDYRKTFLALLHAGRYRGRQAGPGDRSRGCTRSL